MIWAVTLGLLVVIFFLALILWEAFNIHDTLENLADRKGK